MAPKVQLAIVADDLTGALDAAAPFAEVGLRCLVATSPEAIDAALAADPDVIAVSCNSREGSEAEAVATIGQVVRLLDGAGRFFKKVDSRLKGHVAAETAALSRGEPVLICPAIPDMGRIVRGGRVEGFGVDQPIDIQSRFAGMPGLIIPDAETEADIERALGGVGAQVLLVGARGLAAAVARRMGRLRPRVSFLPLPDPVGIAIGSRDPITLAQVAALRVARPGIRYVAAPNGVVPEGEAQGAAIVQAVPGAGDVPSAQVTADLAVGFARLVPGFGSLVLTGGETAAAVLARLGIGVVEVLGEALPGLVLCRASGAGPLILAKSGGFGAPDVLCQLVSSEGEQS